MGLQIAIAIAIAQEGKTMIDEPPIVQYDTSY